MGSATLPLSSAAQGRIEHRQAAYWGRRLTILIILSWVAGLVAGFQHSLEALTVLGFLAAIVGIRWPAAGLLGVALLCAIDSPTRVYLLTGGLLRWNTFNYWLIFVIALGLPLLLDHRSVHARLFQLLILILLAGLIASPARAEGIQHILGAVALLGLIVYLVRGTRYRDSWYWLGVATGTLSAWGGFVFYWQQSELAPINPNAFAYFPLTGLFAISLAAGGSSLDGRKQAVLMALGSFNVLWVFLTGSRGGMLIAVLCLGFMITRARNSSGRTVLLLGAAATAVILVTQFSRQGDYALGRLSRLFDSTYSLSDRTSGRSDLARGGWRILRTNPLGIGTGGFRDGWAERNDLADVTQYGSGKFKQAHSAWIKTLAENGLPGIVVFGAFVASFAIVDPPLRRGEGILSLGVMVSVTLAVAFLSTEFQAKGIWLLAGGGIVLLQQRNRAKQITGVMQCQ